MLKQDLLEEVSAAAVEESGRAGQLFRLEKGSERRLELGAGKRRDESALSDTNASCRNCAQRPFCLPQGLEPAEVDQLESLISRVRSVRRGEYLFHAGDRQRCLYAVKSGVIKILCGISDGSEQITGFRLAGDLLGMEALGSEACANSAVAIEASSVCQIPVERLVEASLASPRFQHQVYLLFARQIANANLALTMIGKSKAEAGLASLLLNLADRYRARGYSSTEFNLSMSRAEIGNYLGITVETVSRLITRFQKDGLLRVNKRHIVIVEPDSLRALAGQLSTQQGDATLQTLARAGA